MSEVSYTDYSASAQRPSSSKTSWSKLVEMKLLPSGSNFLNTRRARSAGVSGLTSRRSVEKSTVK